MTMQWRMKMESRLWIWLHFWSESLDFLVYTMRFADDWRFSLLRRDLIYAYIALRASYLLIFFVGLQFKEHIV
jgi:hypothetical protein